MVSNNNKFIIWVLLLSLLALKTTFQQNYHNYQLLVAPNELVSPYCCDYPVNDQPPFSVCFVPNTKIFLAKAVYMMLRSSYYYDLSTSQLGRFQRYGQVQPFACKLKNLQKTFMVLGSYAFQDLPGAWIFLPPGKQPRRIFCPRARFQINL